MYTGDEPSEYLRKRRLVSTIETSPSRSLLEHSTVTSVSGHGSYVGYCTIRNGMPLHEFSNLTKHKSVSSIFTNASPDYPQLHVRFYSLVPTTYSILKLTSSQVFQLFRCFKRLENEAGLRGTCDWTGYHSTYGNKAKM